VTGGQGLLTHLADKQTIGSRVVHEKLIVAQLVKKFPTFCGTGRFHTMFTGPHIMIALELLNVVYTCPTMPKFPCNDLVEKI
jgi:hypothetical protein